MTDQATVAERFERSDETLRDWERRIREGEPVDVAESTKTAIDVAKDLVKAYLQVLGRDWEGVEDDLLEIGRAHV